VTLLIYFVLQKKLYKDKSWIYILLTLVLIDMWFVNKRYLNADDFVLESTVEAPFELQEYDKIIQQDTTIYRVYNLGERLDQGARTSYFHHSLGGYHGAKLGKYQDLIDFHITKGNFNVINMLNTKYIIVPNDNGSPIVQQNGEALGNAWFVDRVHWVNNANESLELLNSFDPKSTVIIDEKHKKYINQFNFNSEQNIQLISYAPNRLVYDVRSNTSALAVFSEIFYPKGWQAYIDGQSVDHFEVNYVLRGMIIPDGSQQVVFEFKPKSFFISSKISLFASCLLIITALVTCVRLFLLKE
tara:strand:- start:52 stop:951 length:900 start_codon:yes stop_codon:yes gene_type:complete